MSLSLLFPISVFCHLGGCLLVLVVVLMSGGCRVMSSCFPALFAVIWMHQVKKKGFNQSNFMLMGKMLESPKSKIIYSHSGCSFVPSREYGICLSACNLSIVILYLNCVYHFWVQTGIALILTMYKTLQNDLFFQKLIILICSFICLS